MKIIDLIGRPRRNKRGPRIARMIQKEFSLRPHVNESILLEGARIEHPEDMIFTGGSKGARDALDAMTHATQDHDAITIKWDGKPAIIFGRDAEGRFILTDKSGFTAKGYNGLVTSPKAMALMFHSRGAGREELVDMMVDLWPLLEHAVPKNFKGFVQGDLLYASTPAEKNGEFVFTPNTVTYKVDARSPLGQKIAGSRAAVALHSYYANPGAPRQALDSLRGLKAVGPVLMLTANLESTKPILLKDTDVQKANDIISQFGSQIDALLDPGHLRSNKITDLPEHLKRFINLRVRERNLKNLVKGFNDYLNTANLTPSKAKNLHDWITTHKIGMQAAMQLFSVLSNIKHKMVDQLDKTTGHIRAEIAGQPGGEGYVVDTPMGVIKLVKRTNFSATNFARNA